MGKFRFLALCLFIAGSSSHAYEIIRQVVDLPFIAGIPAEKMLPPSRARSFRAQAVPYRSSGFPQLPAEILKKYDRRQIGASIVERLRRYNSKHLRPSGLAYDFKVGSEIQIYFPAAAIEDVLSLGFLNQHQIFSTGGTLNPEVRAILEDQLALLTLDPNYRWGREYSMNAMRPVYANLDLTADLNLGIASSNGAFQYGEVVAILKDSVKERSTWTKGDSLDGALKPRTFSEKQMGDVDPTTPFLEAQVWGGVDLRDISEFRVPPGFSAAKLEQLKRAGLPIYEYQLTDTFGRMKRPVRGRQLYAGDPQRMAAYAVPPSTQESANDSAMNRGPGVIPFDTAHADTLVEVSSAHDPRIQPGAIIKLPSGKYFRIMKSMETTAFGRPARGFFAKPPAGKLSEFTIFDTPPAELPDFLRTIEVLRENGIRVPEIYSSGQDHLIREADNSMFSAEHHWLGFDTYSTESARLLVPLLKQLLTRGIYLQDLQPSDISDTMFEKVISGFVTLGETNDLHSSYAADIAKNWNKNGNAAGICKILLGR